MNRALKIAPELALPLDAITQTFCILAIRGVGKTYTASVMVEEMLKSRLPVVVYDPTGAWWGLKSSADGQSKGFPVVVFGGEHADVPLEETAGDTIATTIVEKRIPAILDVSLLRKGARTRFMTDFLETLYHKNREPLHLVADEAHTIAPMNLKAMPEAARVLGAMEDIILQGRRRGLGMTVISQRPALLNTNIRTQCQSLIAMRIIGTHDLKAVMEWVQVHADETAAKDMLKNLPTLPVGEAYFWSPAWLKVFKSIKVRQRETFDSSATPKAGEKAITPKAWADVDLEALGEAIKKTVQQKKENDPAILKRRIAELEKANTKTVTQSPPLVETKLVEVSVVKASEVSRLESAIEKLTKKAEDLLGLAQDLSNQSADIKKALAVARREGEPSRAQVPPPRPSPRPASATPPRQPRMSPATSNGSLPKGESAVLTAIAQYPDGAERDQLTVLTDYKRSSRDTYIQRLRERGYVDQAGDRLLATEEGIGALGDAFEPLPTGEALRDYWIGRLPEGERRVLEVLITNYPQPISREVIDEQTGYKRSSRDTYLQRLGSRRLVESVGRGEVKASDELFA